jgi:Holliday junction resolvasome RuvABC endonuclease subunit
VHREEVIVGIDSSLSCTGIAILSEDLEIIETTKIKTKPDQDLLDRYFFIINEIILILDRYKIIRLGIEQPNTARNLKNARMLIGLYQLIRFMLYKRYNVFPHELNTKTIKLCVSGNGNAEKPVMIKAINKIFKTKLKFSTKKEDSDDDIADALGVAYTLENLPQEKLKGANKW